MVLDMMDKYVTQREYRPQVEQLKKQIVESSENQDMHYRMFKTNIISEVNALKLDHLKGERAIEIRCMVVEEMKEFIKKLLDSRLQAYQKISDVPIPSPAIPMRKHAGDTPSKRDDDHDSSAGKP
jgi:hypothetical protein